MKLSLHDPAQPIPAGAKPFVSLELDGKAPAAPSMVAEQSKPIPHEDILENMRINVASGVPVMEKRPEPRHRRMALACFGPSLVDTWEELRDFEGDIWTTSGAHRFLRDRGIVPDFHTECDPRAHKAKFLQNPHPYTRYVLASRVHPSMTRHVCSLQTRLFHMDIKSERDECLRLSPGAELVRTGTTNGMSALELGLWFGYTDFTVLGMDGSFREEEHAGPHPNPREHAWSEVEVEGRRFYTSMLHLLALQDFFTIALSNPQATFEFRGDGMIPWAVGESKRKWREAHGHL